MMAVVLPHTKLSCIQLYPFVTEFDPHLLWAAHVAIRAQEPADLKKKDLYTQRVL